MDANAILNSEFPRAHFESNERFQKQRKVNTEDNKFYRAGRNKFGQSQRMNADGLNAFLGAQQGEGVRTAAEKICEQDLGYRDLSLLTDEDLELMGFKFQSERDNLLKYFSELPNQDPTYEELCKHPDAEGYNRLILKKGANHLKTMKHALDGANYKLQLNMPDDVLVGEQYFASRFVVDALDEVNKATHEIGDELEELYQVLDTKTKERKSWRPQWHWLLFAAASGASAVLAFWYFKHRQ